MALSKEQEERYQRQIILSEIGPTGQERLLRAGVLVVGAGGLGSAACYYLAAAGVGRIGIVDRDRVELSNLQRQIIHTAADLGRPKVESAREKLLALNPGITVNACELPLTSENAASLVRDYDVVVGAVDNLDARYHLNAACFQERKPLIEGAVGGFRGQLTTFLPLKGPCYRCLFPEGNPAPSKPPGLVGALPGMIGALEACEALKVILGIGEPLIGRLLLFDALANESTIIEFSRNPCCPICGKS